jgi:1,4-dihydroxy-2-naphthoate polyprenyltransferase
MYTDRVRRVVAFVRLGRPLFLGGGVLMFGLGVAIARAAGHSVDVRRYVLGQLAVTAFQLMTHYANDYFDYDADRANATPTRWSGGSRVLPAGELPRGVALVAAIIFAAIGAAVGAIVADDARIAGTLAAIAAFAWAYSAPPLRLCARGVGELDTVLVVTVLVPWLGFALQAPDLAGARVLALAIVPLALLQFAMLLAIELPDAASDAAAGKATLIVRLGATRGAQLMVAVTAAAYAWLPIAWLLGLPARVAVAAALPVPLALWRIARSGDHRDVARYEQLTFGAVALLITTGAAELAALL